MQPAAPGDNLVTNGRLKDGVVACEACHRRTGEGDAASAFSNLTGLTKEYIAKQLKDFQSGARESRVMQVVAQNLSAADIEALSSYYASLPPLPLSTNIPEAPQIGIALAQNGDASRGLRSCISCHSRNAINANRKIPVLYGQVPLYLRNQLIGWQDGSRKNDAAQRWRKSRRRFLRPKSTPFRFTSPDCRRRRRSGPWSAPENAPGSPSWKGALYKAAQGHCTPGSAQTFAELARGHLSNPETDRAPGSCRRARGLSTEAQPAPRSAPRAASRI